MVLVGDWDDRKYREFRVLHRLDMVGPTHRTAVLDQLKQSLHAAIGEGEGSQVALIYLDFANAARIACLAQAVWLGLLRLRLRL